MPVVAIALIFSNEVLLAQNKITEGKIKFAITFPKSKPGDKYLAMMPKEKIIYFKGGNSRTESSTPMGNVISLHFSKSGENYTCVDRNGTKTAMKTTDQDMKEFKGRLGMEKPLVKLTTETKKIAGINCKKTIVTYNNKDGKKVLDVWYTNEIVAPNSNDNFIEGIPGFMMEYTAVDKDETMLITCASVERIKVSDDLFKIPEGYTVKTMKEIMGQ